MEEIKLVIDKFVTNHQAVTSEEGTVIYKKLMDYFKQGNTIILDFSGLDIATTAFLNVVIGDLYKTYKTEQLKKLLSFEGLDESGKKRIKMVTDTAKSFYNDQKGFSEIINSEINGNS